MSLATFFSGLDNLFAQKNIAAAEGYLAEHLAKAQQLGDMNYQLAVLNEQVGYYRSLSHFAKSLEAGEAAMQIINAPGFDQKVSAATTMLNVATALRAAGKIEAALEMYKEVDKLYLEHLDGADPRRAALYNNMAQALLASGNSKGALEHLQEALAILNISRPYSAECATNNTNIAAIYMSLGDSESAEEYLHKAMEIFESLDYEDAHYPAALGAMAQLMYFKGDYCAAVEHYRSALRKTKDIFGQNADYVRICRNCAKACAKAGMTEDAETMLKMAATAEEKLNSKRSKS